MNIPMLEPLKGRNSVPVTAVLHPLQFSTMGFLSKRLSVLIFSSSSLLTMPIGCLPPIRASKFPSLQSTSSASFVLRLEMNNGWRSLDPFDPLYDFLRNLLIKQIEVSQKLTVNAWRFLISGWSLPRLENLIIESSNQVTDIWVSSHKGLLHAKHNSEINFAPQCWRN